MSHYQGVALLDFSVRYSYSENDDRQEGVSVPNRRGFAASAIYGLHVRFFAGPAGYAVLRHIGVLTGKSESRLLRDDDFRGNTQNAGEGSCLTGCVCVRGCRTRTRA